MNNKFNKLNQNSKNLKKMKFNKFIKIINKWKITKKLIFKIKLVN